MYVCATKTNSGIGGSSEIGKADAAFIATARTGYPATLSATKYAILALSEIEQNGFCHTEKAMNFILTEIELLQCE
jgi:hypothetical protein